MSLKRYNISITTIILSCIALLESCSPQDTPPTKSREDIVADSLQAVADSIALTRQMHSIQIGYHQHSTPSLSSVQHTIPKGKKKIRFKKKQYTNTEAKETSPVSAQ